MRQAQKYPYSDEETFVDVVNARLREIMTAVVKHQHSAVTAREQTHDE